MKKAIKTGLKFILGTFGVLLLMAGIFTAFNFTLIKNLPTAQDGGMDAMYIANQNPLQLVVGAQSDDLPIDDLTKEHFTPAQTYWEETGGKALLVWHKGSLIYEHYAEGVQPSDRSRSFSMHKSVLGLVAATMEADGLLNLDDPVSLFVEAYKSGGREELTLRNMLQHQTGLERYSFSPPDWNALNLLLSSKVEKTGIKAKQIADPSVFDYSNINYQVAGAVIRRVLKEKTSQTYAEYLSSRIWVPAGAGEAYLWSETETGAPRFYAGLQATPRDWLKIGIMIAENNDTVVPKSAISTILTPSVVNSNYGLGTWLGFPDDGTREYGPSTAMSVPGAAPFIVPDTVFFDGFGGQRVYMSPSEQLVIVRIGDVRFDWDDTALPNLVAQALGLLSAQETTLILKTETERDIPIRVISPKAGCDDCKLAIFSHGAFASNEDYNAVIEPLVSAGYRAVIPLHPDSKSHPLTTSFSPTDYLKLRIEDHNAILSHYAQNSGQPKEWISAGHSFGAMVALLYGGAGQEGHGIEALPLGAPSHVIALSPPGAIKGYFEKSRFSGLTTPTLLVTGTTDVVPGMITDWEDHLDAYKGAPKNVVQAAVFDKRDHYFNGLYGRRTERNRDGSDQALIKLISDFIAGEPLEGADGYDVLR